MVGIHGVPYKEENFTIDDLPSLPQDHGEVDWSYGESHSFSKSEEKGVTLSQILSWPS